MTQVLDEFEMLLEESFAKSNTVADIVEGTVIKKESDSYLVSVKGAKMEAYLPNRELSSDAETLEVGAMLSPGEKGILAAAEDGAEMKWQVVKVYTMPDGQKGVKVMRIA